MRHARLAGGTEELEARTGRPPFLAPPLQQALLGAVFPLSAEQLVQVARENGAPPVVLSLLSDLPRRSFASLEAVVSALQASPEATG